MRLFKYRDLSNPTEGLPRLRQILLTYGFWAASADTLNDPDEYFWDVDYSPTAQTASLLSRSLVTHRGLALAEAASLARHSVELGRVAAVAAPVLGALQQRIRSTVGVVCFGGRPDNMTLWERYAASGNGVCVELDAPDSLLGDQLHEVEYVSDKRVHIDTFLAASAPDAVRPMYKAALLTKTRAWEGERETRYLSRIHGVAIRLQKSQVVRLWLGRALEVSIRKQVLQMVQDLPYPVTVAEGDA